MVNIQKKLLTGILIVCIAVALYMVFRPERTHSQTAGPILGYAWSDTIGWIDLNCANTSSCGSIHFGLSADQNGVVSGYAWSDNIGWVSANAGDLAGCPSASCSATISNDAFSGWLKALSGGSSQSGDWDGFISLSGSGYGVTRTGGSLSGYAWGSTVVGWTDFAFTISADVCPNIAGAQSSPPANGHLAGNECVCDSGYHLDGDQCVLGEENQCSPAYVCYGNDLYQRTGEQCTDETFVQTCSYACSSGACILPQFSGNITATPTLLRSGETSTVSWTTSGMTACAVSENNPTITDAWAGANDTQQSSPITEQTIYTLACNVEGGGIFTDSVTVNIVPVFCEIGAPGCGQ